MYKTFHNASPLDGKSRLYGVRKIDGLPFVIVIGEADQDWKANWLQRLGVTVAAVVILWGLAFVTLRYYWDRLDNLVELKKAHDSLEELSLTDALTGLANRRHFDEVLYAEFRRMSRSNAPISVVMIDIDYFKAFNDTYGHLKGDECLRGVGGMIKKTLKRSQDLAARYGGEEFVCILPETSNDAAVAIATSIKDNIVDLAYRHEGSKVADYVTVSLGVATVGYKKDFLPEYVVKMADKNLYWAKNNGRNCVGHAESGIQ